MFFADFCDDVGDGAIAQGQPIRLGCCVTFFGEVDKQLFAVGKLVIDDGLVGLKLVEAFGGINFVFNDADEVIAGGVNQQVNVAPFAANIGIVEAEISDVEIV